jgi:hypothetical protein
VHAHLFEQRFARYESSQEGMRSRDRTSLIPVSGMPRSTVIEYNLIGKTRFLTNVEVDPYAYTLHSHTRRRHTKGTRAKKTGGRLQLLW